MRLAEILQMDLSEVVSKDYGERPVLLGLLALESTGGAPISTAEFARRAKTTPTTVCRLLSVMKRNGAIVCSFNDQEVRGYIHQRMFHKLADRSGGAA